MLSRRPRAPGPCSYGPSLDPCGLPAAVQMSDDQSGISGDTRIDGRVLGDDFCLVALVCSLIAPAQSEQARNELPFRALSEGPLASKHVRYDPLRGR